MAIPGVVASGAECLSAGSVVVPAAPANGAMALDDLRVVIFSVSNTTITTPAGWFLATAADVFQTSRRIYRFWRPHPGGSETDHTFTLGAANNYSMIQLGIRGADLADPFDTTFPIGSGSTSVGGLVAPTMNTTEVDTLLICSFHLLLNGSSITLSNPSGMDDVIQQAGNGSNGHAARVSTLDVPAIGATGDKTSTGSSSGVWGATSMAVRAAPAIVVPPRRRTRPPNRKR